MYLDTSVTIPVLIVIIFLLVLAFFMLTTVRGWWVRRRLQKDEEAQQLAVEDQPILEWLDEVDSDDPVKIVNAGAPPEGYRAIYRDEVEAALEKQRNAEFEVDILKAERVKRDENKKKAQAILKEARAESDPLIRFDALYELYDTSWHLVQTVGPKAGVLDLPEREASWVTNQLKTLAPKMVEQRFERARHGSEEDFTVIREFMESGDKRLMFGEIAYPADWNELVARFVKAPSLKDFRFDESAPHASEARGLAAEALEEDSLLKAKVVLARCDVESESGSQFRSAVNDVLIAELARLIARHHLKSGLGVSA